MPVNVQLDALRRLDAGEPGGESGRLEGVALLSTLVVFGARAGRGTARDGPLVGPVTVDIAADAATARVGLAVLAPEAVVGLGVDEA